MKEFSFDFISDITGGLLELCETDLFSFKTSSHSHTAFGMKLLSVLVHVRGDTIAIHPLASIHIPGTPGSCICQSEYVLSKINSNLLHRVQ